jgi:hypothetical protein
MTVRESGQLAAIAHLLLRLGPIRRLLQAAAARITAATAALPDAPARAMFLSDGEVAALFAETAALPAWAPGASPELSPQEAAAEHALRAEAKAVLPLDALAQHLALDAVDLEALAVCAAPEIDRGYERLFAYVLDDLTRRGPCVELLCALSARAPGERHARRARFAPHGLLVRAGVLQLGPPGGSEWKREVRLTPAAVSFLLGHGGDAACFTDPAEVRRPPAPLHGVDDAAVERAARLVADVRGAVVSSHGPRDSAAAEVPIAVAARAGVPLRHLSWSLAVTEPRQLTAASDLAAALGAALWISVDGALEPSAEERALRALEALPPVVPLLFSGVHPMRPLGVMAARPFFEISARPLTLADARAAWDDVMPDIAEPLRQDVAANFRLAPDELRAVANVFSSVGPPNGDTYARLQRACRTVARRRSGRVAVLLSPGRQPEDLVLPEPVHRAVIDVARFARAWPVVSETWGMGRMNRGGRGVRALFYGPSGTGKTLAAEVIAGMLGQDLLKADLASMVSKWVGETEKNLDTVFEEAEQSQAVLFFDEADALFSKRGEVRHGVDRYANLEVSYLLQRLEDFAGVVLLASNLKENLDEAFLRRFHVTVEFPRPSEIERRRLWSLAFSPQVPIEGVDLQVLARLDMTGATIVNAARTAALLAVADGGTVRAAHVAEGVSREFRRESRLLLPAEVALLRGAC